MKYKANYKKIKKNLIILAAAAMLICINHAAAKKYEFMGEVAMREADLMYLEHNRGGAEN